MLRLDSDVQYVKGVGPRRSSLLTSCGIRTVEDLLLHKDRARVMGENALKFASTQYDFCHYISGLERLFEDVIATRRERATV